MDILEAFEKGDNIKIWDEINSCETLITKGEGGYIPLRLVFLKTWQPVIEPLTFEKIKAECVAGESLLVNECGVPRLYLGFTRKDTLVTDSSNGFSSLAFDEDQIKNWKISDEKWGGNNGS